MQSKTKRRCNDDEKQIARHNSLDIYGSIDVPEIGALLLPLFNHKQAPTSRPMGHLFSGKHATIPCNQEIEYLSGPATTNRSSSVS
jgi:hypothetical protein